MARESYERRWGHSRTHKATNPERIRRRIEAEERNAKWRALSIEMKLYHIAHRPGNCTKQVLQLRLELIRAEQKRGRAIPT